MSEGSDPRTSAPFGRVGSGSEFGMDRRTLLRRGVGMAGALSLTSLVAACGDDDGSARTSEKSGTTTGGEGGKTIAFSFLYSEVPAAAALKRFAKDRAEQLGHELLTDNIRGGKTDEQLASLDSFLTRKVDALVVHAVDPAPYGPILDRARQAKVPFFTYATAVPGSDGGVLFPPDQATADVAKDAADWIEENLAGEQAQVLLLTFTASPEYRKASESLDDVITARGLGRVVASQDAIDQETGLNVTQRALTAHPDVNVVLCVNDGGALGAAQALKQARKDPAKTYVASAEGTESGIQAILKGDKYIKLLAQLSVKKLGYGVIDIVQGYFESGKTGDIVAGRTLIHSEETDKLKQALLEY